MEISRRELYERYDRPALKPLPPGRYEMAVWKECGAQRKLPARGTQDGRFLRKRRTEERLRTINNFA